MSVRVVVVDDQPTIRLGLAMILDHEPDVVCVGQAGDGAAAVAEVLRVAPDVVLLDVRMPGVDGVEATRRLRGDARTARVRIVVLTTFDDEEYLVGALRAGADAFLLKDCDPPTLIRTVHAVCRGEQVLDPKVTGRLVDRWLSLERSGRPVPGAASAPELTDRERQLLGHLADGLTNRQIAGRFGVTESSVKGMVHGLLTRTGCVSRAQLVARAGTWGAPPR